MTPLCSRLRTRGSPVPELWMLTSAGVWPARDFAKGEGTERENGPCTVLGSMATPSKGNATLALFTTLCGVTPPGGRSRPTPPPSVRPWARDSAPQSLGFSSANGRAHSRQHTRLSSEFHDDPGLGQGRDSASTNHSPVLLGIPPTDEIRTELLLALPSGSPGAER